MKHNDTELLNWLQQQLNKNTYTGRIVFRWSNHGRGIRLHETSLPESKYSVREALEDAMVR